MAQRPVGEGVFNIFPNLLVGADAKLKSDLQLDIPVSDSTNAYISMEQFGDVSLTVCSVCVPVCVHMYVFSLLLNAGIRIHVYTYVYVHMVFYVLLRMYI